MTPWTEAEEAWLRAEYPDCHNADLPALYAAAFPEGPARTEIALRSRAKLLGLRKREGHVRNPPKLWTPERAAWFRAYVPGHTEREISAEHERLYGFPLTESQIGNGKTRLGVKSGTCGGRFGKGHVPANKGRTWDEMGVPPESRARSLSTCFKPGDMPWNGMQPVGTERTDRDGYVWVKVAERKSDPRSAHDNWRPKHVLAYESAYGPVPEGCNVVFADRDKSNLDPSNLVAVPRGAWAVIARNRMPYYDRGSLEACIALASLMHARSEAERSV